MGSDPVTSSSRTSIWTPLSFMTLNRNTSFQLVKQGEDGRGINQMVTIIYHTGIRTFRHGKRNGFCSLTLDSFRHPCECGSDSAARRMLSHRRDPVSRIGPCPLGPGQTPGSRSALQPPTSRRLRWHAVGLDWEGGTGELGRAEGNTPQRGAHTPRDEAGTRDCNAAEVEAVGASWRSSSRTKGRPG